MKTPLLITALRHGLLLLLLACALHSLPGRAQTPQYMTYQGYLTDQNGGALATNGPQAYSVVFRIWNQPTGGATPLYGELQTVTVANGYFSVLLGQGSSYINLGVTDPRPPLSTVFTTNNSVSTARYVEMTVKGIGTGGADVTILPRLQLVSAPYAFLAGNANALVSSTTGTNIITSSGNTVTVNGNENVLNSVAVTGSSNPSLSVNDGTAELDLALALASGSWSLGASAHDAVVRNTNGKLILQSGSGNPGLVLDTANNLGIGTATPAGPLNIKELTGTVAGGNNGTIVLDHADTGGASSIVFRSKNNRGSDLGYIQYQDDSTIGGSGEASLLTIGVQNDASQDNLALLPAGNVGVGTTTPNLKLQVNGNVGARDTTPTDGYVDFQPGTSGSAGYVEWFKPGVPSRIAYMGWSDGGVNNLGLNLQSANFNINGGNVGIGLGAGNPAYTLDVSGSLRASSGIQTTYLTSSGGMNVSGGWTLLNQTADNTSGNVAIGSGGFSNVKVYLKSSEDYALYADSTSSYHSAGYFGGNVGISGSLSKGAGSFKIDHPLDPENKWLYHSFVESPDMMNVYNGNIVTDGNGDATVALPSYFQALNKDFRYQLTVIGQFAQAIVGSEISSNSSGITFGIKTDKPNVKVSWQVTGIRQDAFANAHRIVPEVAKVGVEAGAYIHPVEHGKPESKRMNLLKGKEVSGTVSPAAAK